MNYCLPIRVKTKKEVLDTIKASREYDLFEIWLDYIEDLDMVFVNHLVKTYEEKLVLLFRRDHLEKPLMGTEQQREIIQAIEGKTCYLDLDLTQTELQEYIKTNSISVNLIASYHNYDHTPENSVLNDIVADLRNHNPAIIKLATLCHTESDSVRLLEILLKLKAENETYIVLGMGEFGTIARLAGTMWGNAITFAPKDASQATAPGQLTKKEIEEILSTLSSTV